MHPGGDDDKGSEVRRADDASENGAVAHDGRGVRDRDGEVLVNNWNR